MHRAYGGNEFRTVTLDIDPVRAPNIGVVDFGHGAGREINKNEIATGRAYEGSRTYEGGRTYEHEERRRIEAEAAAAGAASRGTAAGGRHYSTEYEYHSNSSWDSATGGRPRVDSSSRWSINDNGTVHAGKDLYLPRDNAKGRPGGAMARLDKDHGEPWCQGEAWWGHGLGHEAR